MSGQAVHELTIDDCWNRIGVWSLQAASCPQLEHCVHCRNCEHYSAAGRSMLEQAVPEDYRREWTKRYARAEGTGESCANSVLMFRLGDEWLGIDSRCVCEITRVETIHSIPHRTDSMVKGLVNIRGELKLCVSIGSVLQLEKATESYQTNHDILERMILIEKDEQSFIFPVSEVEGIFRYADHQLRSLPATVANARSKLTTGIVLLKDQSVGILDHDLLFFALARKLS